MTDEGRGKTTLAEILVQSSVDGLFAVDRESRYTLWNSAMEQFAGKRADEVLGRHIFDVFPFLRDLGLDRALDQAMAGETIVGHAIPSAVPSGAVHYFDRHYAPLRDDDGAVVGVVGVVRDVTAKRDAEEALRSTEEKLGMALEASGIGLWSWDTQADEVTWDAALCSIFGIPLEAAPKTRLAYRALIHPDDRERAAIIITEGVTRGSWEGEHRILHADGLVRWILTKGTVSRRDGRVVALGAVIDVTDRRHREEQLRQSQKLEAVGQLTAGIAHNFNNILMALLANLELAALTAPAELEPLLTTARQSATRAADLVRQLMTFAGRHHRAARTIEPIGELVEHMVAFCRTTFDRRILLDATYDARALANVDAPQIEQAVLNVLINARDAVTDAPVDEPRVTIDVDVVYEGSPELSGRTSDHVRIRVRDNGIGMNAATVARIFEPFFTTKEIDKGTGLGLATTHSILRDHGGFITCDSAARRGATFSLYLVLEANPREVTRASPSPTGGRASETILVVDDEAPIRAVVARMLTSAGYTPRLAASGQEAIDLLTDARVASEVALMLLDVSMPGISGRPLRSRLRELAPHARVVYFTGFAFDAVDPDDGVLQKPITMQLLLATIREVLDRRSEPAPRS
jgi:PAS domain S-box-containing protein